jgi:hypothetical protein
MPDQDTESARVEPVQWEVRPAGIEKTRFDDPETFYLTIRRSTWNGEPVYIVSPHNRSTAFTKNGRLVFQRHDVNAKHARHASFEEAATLARAIVDGVMQADAYRTWRDAEALHFPTTVSTDTEEPQMTDQYHHQGALR